MFHKILVAIDRSVTSRQGFETALSLAQATGASLILLHILSLDDEESPHLPILFGKDFYPSNSSRSIVQIYEELWKDYEERGKALLQAMAAEATAIGIPITFAQGAGSAGSMICEYARHSNVDLIVMGRQGHAGLNELILGSVSNYVLHHAPCSVLVVHPPSETGSDTSQNHQVATVS